MLKYFNAMPNSNMKGRCNMIKFLSIDATTEVIQHWRNLGYTIVFTFCPKGVTK
jgi:hypothetical protein